LGDCLESKALAGILSVRRHDGFLDDIEELVRNEARKTLASNDFEFEKCYLEMDYLS
jgi:hypothetical protein